MAKLYTIESESKYHMKLVEINNIEDAGDDFYTNEEIGEMLGVEASSDGSYYISTYSPIVKRHLVVDALFALKAELKEKNKKSMIITDTDLIEFFKETSNSVSDFVPGLRRVGNRLSIHEKAEKVTANKKDLQSLISCGCRCISKKYGYDFDIKYAYQNYLGAVEVIQKVVTFDEIETFVNNQGYDDWKKALVWFKMIWDDPEQYAEGKKVKED